MGGTLFSQFVFPDYLESLFSFILAATKPSESSRNVGPVTLPTALQVFGNILLAVFYVNFLTEQIL